MENQEIIIPKITLEWTKWLPWNSFKIDARSGEGIQVPNESGVYEVKKNYESERRVHIGRAKNLRHRIKQGLVKGKSPHSAGKGIRTELDVSKLVIRWSITERPCAVEEELHFIYYEKFRMLPDYTEQT